MSPRGLNFSSRISVDPLPRRSFASQCPYPVNTRCDAMIMNEKRTDEAREITTTPQIRDGRRGVASRFRVSLLARRLFAKRLQLLQSLPPHRFLRLHHLDERVEQVRRVVRAGGRFGLVLDAEDGKVLVTESFDRAVIQVHVR